MGSLILILIPILLSDVINPVLLAAMVFALGSKRPLLNANAVLFGWLSLYFIAGIVLALGLESISEFLANPRPMIFISRRWWGFYSSGLPCAVLRKKIREKKKKN